MSNATLPALAGLRYPAKRRPIWSGKVQTAVSGKETRLSYWSYPRYQWTIGYEFLRTAAGANDLASLIGFYNARRGQFDDWLWTDPDDSGVTMQPIGTGDGVTTAFGLARSFGGYAEPVSTVSGVATIYVNAQPANLVANSSFEQQAAGIPWGFTQYNGVAISTTYTAPIGRAGGSTLAYGLRANAASTSTFGLRGDATLTGAGVTGGVRAGGWQPNTTYQVSFYARKINGSGWAGMALGWNINPSATTAVANPALNGTYQRYVFSVAWGATVETVGGFFIFAAGNTAINDEIQIDDIQIVIGASIPAYSGGESYTIDTAGTVNFDVPPPIGASLAWTGSYYWRVRFDDIDLTLDKMMGGLWSSGDISFTSVK